MIMPSGKQPAPGPLARKVSAHIRMVMEREGVTKTALAKASGLSRNYLSKRLLDEVPLTLNDVEAVCAALGIEVPDLK